MLKGSRLCSLFISKWLSQFVVPSLGLWSWEFLDWHCLLLGINPHCYGLQIYKEDSPFLNDCTFVSGLSTNKQGRGKHFARETVKKLSLGNAGHKLPSLGSCKSHYLCFVYLAKLSCLLWGSVFMRTPREKIKKYPWLKFPKVASKIKPNTQPTVLYLYAGFYFVNSLLHLMLLIQMALTKKKCF